jgi:hypothetical protein
MDIKEALKSQYQAGLDMLEDAVKQCPEALWADPEPKNKFWHIAYHALFYTHLYLQTSEGDFTPWEHHRENSQFLGPNPRRPDLVPIAEPYSKQEVLDYLGFCRKEVGKKVPGLNLDAESGFSWISFGKLEHQIYNIRHLQHHTGQLIDRLRTKAGIGVRWVGRSTGQ